MIREMDLKKTKFFTTNGADIWKVTAVNTVTEVEMVNCETGQTGTIRIGESSAKGFLAVTMPKVTGAPSARVKKKTKQKAIKKKVKADKTKSPSIRTTGHGIRAGKKPSSQYLGVHAVKGKKYTKYLAQINRGKFVYLGTFRIEEEAAAAVQDHLGNKEEAARLRMIVEQKDTNIVNSTLKRNTYMCTGCGASYEKKPEKCTHCGSGSFTKSRAE